MCLTQNAHLENECETNKFILTYYPNYAEYILSYKYLFRIHLVSEFYKYTTIPLIIHYIISRQCKTVNSMQFNKAVQSFIMEW